MSITTAVCLVLAGLLSCGVKPLMDEMIAGKRRKRIHD
jgi:hypothetical protein